MINAVARAMRQRHPADRVAVVYLSSRYGRGGAATLPDASIYENSPHIDEVIVTTRLRFLFRRLFGLRSGWRFIYARKAYDSYKKKIAKGRVVHPRGVHAIELMANLHGLRDVEFAPNISLRDEEREKVDNILEENGFGNSPFIIIETETKKDFSNKRWLPENWRRLVELLRERWPSHAIIQISPGQMPLEGVRDISGRTSFREAARFLERSALFIGPEGGLMHLAAAVGRASVILHSGYDPVELTAYPMHAIIHHQIECSACGYLDDCPNGRKCMALITPEEVVGAAESILAARAP